MGDWAYDSAYSQYRLKDDPPHTHLKLETLVASFGVGLQRLRGDGDLQMAFKFKWVWRWEGNPGGKEMIIGDGKIIANMKSLCHTFIPKPVTMVCILLVAVPLIY